MELPDDNAVERIWSEDRRRFFAIVKVTDCSYKLESFVLRLDREENVEYWSGSMVRPTSIFGDMITAREEATRLLKTNGDAYA